MMLDWKQFKHDKLPFLSELHNNKNIFSKLIIVLSTLQNGNQKVNKEKKNIISMELKTISKESKKSKRVQKRTRKFGVKTRVQDLEGYGIIINYQQGALCR
jgi:hypothetical protein